MKPELLFGTNKIGKLSGDKFKTSMLGLAIKNDSGEYVRYDANTNTITNVTPMVIDGLDYVIAIPATEVSVGDLILRGDDPLYVKAVNDDKSLTVINPLNDREETYLPQKMLFGFRVYVKVISLVGAIMPKVEDGNIEGDFNSLVLPMILAGAFGKEGKKGGIDDVFKIILMSSVASGTNPFATVTGGTTGGANSFLPLLVFAGMLDSEGENSLGKLMPLLMMSNLTPPTTSEAAR